MTLLVATIGGAICGAILVGMVIMGFVWWRGQQRISTLRDNLNRPIPAAGIDMPSSRYYNNPSAYVPPPVRPDIETMAPPPSPPAGVAPGMAWLDGVGGIVTGQRMVLTKEETLMGRSGVCDVQFHDPKVSRQHALLRLYNNDYFIQDMQSSRGTYINGRRMESHQLQDRDKIQLGDTILVFRRY